MLCSPPYPQPFLPNLPSKPPDPPPLSCAHVEHRQLQLEVSKVTRTVSQALTTRPAHSRLAADALLNITAAAAQRKARGE